MTRMTVIGALIASLSMLTLPYDSDAGAQDSTLALGERIFQDKCEYCHGAGVQKGGTYVLQARYQGALPALLTERTDLAPEYVRAVLRTWTNGMAPFRPTEISDSELEALIAYLTGNEE